MCTSSRTGQSLRMLILLFFLAGDNLSGIQFVSGQTKKGNATGCLSRFFREPQHFERCKTKICFLFKHQPPVSTHSHSPFDAPVLVRSLTGNCCPRKSCGTCPGSKFIKLDSRMKTEEHQELFDCRNRRKTFRNLAGTIFEVHQNMKTDNELCVWSGAGCSFNGMVAFIGERARDNRTKDYRFGITGFLQQLPSRVSVYTIPTVSLMESEIIVLGPSNLPKGPIQRSFKQIFRAVQANTWIILGVIALFFLVLAVCISTVFSAPFNVFNIVMALFGENVQYQLPPSQLPSHQTRSFLWENQNDPSRFQNLRLLHRVALTVLRIALIAFTVICEITIVNFIFHRQSPQVGKNLEDLSIGELGAYTISKSTAQEDVWIRAVDPFGSRFKEGDYPWHRSASASESYKEVLNASNKIKFMVTFGAAVNYQLRRNQACELLTKYETSTPLYSFGIGWYLSKSVPEEARAEINRELLQLRLMNEMKITQHGEDSAKSCGKKSMNIGPEVIAIPLLLIVGPCILALVLFLFGGCYMRAKMARRQRNIIQKAPDITHPAEAFSQPYWSYPQLYQYRIT